MKAESTVRHAIRLYPKSWKYWAYLADVIYAVDTDRAKEAIEADHKALALNPPATAQTTIKGNMSKFAATLRSKEIGRR